MSYVEALATSRIPPPKGAKVCGNCSFYCELSDSTALCLAKSRKYNILYLPQGERTESCQYFDPNLLLDLARVDVEYEDGESPKAKR